MRTLLLLGVCYATVAYLVINPMAYPLWICVLILIPFITLHSSLQHEFLHGHPFRSQLLNDLLVVVSLGVFIPYFRFKETHLKHHDNSIVSDPIEDPESWYLLEEDWNKISKFQQKLLTLNNTLFGRILFGPALSLTKFTLCELIHGDRRIRLTWLIHTLLMTGYLWVLSVYASMPIWAYLICCYFGLSLLGIRTFLEHQAHENITARTVIIERKGFFSFLFLNNNFHSVHHGYPNVAWYRIPALFERNRDRFLGKNNSYYFESYSEIFVKYFFKAKEPVIYPIKRKL
ncbi:fatty acid desaturase [Curvivirga sp.]|uniref:fatty acid desaturase n=1 Tax=Curvivirga sp. TaxID=2856848 RepID=UPI003B5C4ABC